MAKIHRRAQQAYEKRGRLLRELGFDSYKTYLSSPLWHSIRAKVLVGGVKCYGCPGKANQVHHGRYTRENLSGTSLRYLYPICRDCHERIEFERGKKKSNSRHLRKRSPEEATKQLRRLRPKAPRKTKPLTASVFVDGVARIVPAAGQTTAGGWTKAQLAAWGIPWPPPKGWRRELERRLSQP